MHSFPISSTNNLTRQRKKKANQSKQLNHHEAMGKKSNIGLNRLTCYETTVAIVDPTFI